MEFVAAAVGLGNLIGGLFGSKKQKKIDRRQTELEYKSNLEDIRRRRFDQQSIQGQSKAFSENAGVLHTGGSSAQGFLDTMAREFEKEITFMRDFANEARTLGLKQARLNYQTGVLNSITGGLQGYSNMGGTFGR